VELEARSPKPAPGKRQVLIQAHDQYPLRPAIRIVSMMEEQPKPEARLHAVVHGRVQGVNFRYYTVRTAQRLGLNGWVANRWDGTVETVAEGSQKALGEFRAFLHRGSPSAWVQQVDVDWLPPTGKFDHFGVRYL